MIQIGINIAVKGEGNKIPPPPSVPVSSAPPVISGTTTLGSVLTTTNGTWTNSPTSYTYQWKRGATNIGTNANTYTLVAADSLASITCVVTAINAAGSSIPATSNTITAGDYAPVNTLAPVITPFLYPDATVGDTLTTSNGAWTWSGIITFAYQWYRQPDLGGPNDPIIGATSSSYTLLFADADYLVSCEVTATDAVGSTSVFSNSLYVYDTDYYINVYSWTGYTTEPQSHYQNRLMLGLKSSGAWAKLDLFYVFATNATTAGDALVQWKSGFPAGTLVNSPTFTANQGFTGNGVDAYIDTQFDPYNMGMNYQQDNASRYFFPYAFAGAGPMDGSIQGGGGSRNKMLLNNSTDHKINQNGTVPLSSNFEYTTTVEPKSIHRTSATDVTLYNGTVADNRTAASDALSTVNLYILRDTNDYADHTVAAYAVGASMVVENTAFVAAWDTYITSI
jgi:hypothetical protein